MEEKELSRFCVIPKTSFLNVITEIEKHLNRRLILIHIVIHFNIGSQLAAIANNLRTALNDVSV